MQSAYLENWKGGSTVLLWGDTVGMIELRDFLRSVCCAPHALTLGRFCKAVDGRMIIVTASSTQSDKGMRLAGDNLEWRLRPELAEDYAEKVDALTTSISGHQYLEANNGDITVEVSIGEYPETLRP